MAVQNDGVRAFDIGALAEIDRESYELMQPFQWPQRHDAAPDETRFFASGGFYTNDGKARIFAVRPPSLRLADAAFPLTLNTGRVRDHWHTMTRTGKSPRLSQHLAEPFAEIHPDDARRFGISDVDIVRVSSMQGAVLVRALVSDRQSRGSVFVPMHWTDQFAASARIDRLVPAITDPHSGQPASKCVPVKIERFAAKTYSFAVLSERPNALTAPYWALARCAGGFRLELAFDEARSDWSCFAASLFEPTGGAENLAFHDARLGNHRFACFDGDRLVAALFVASEPVAVSRAWACEQLTRAHQSHRAHMAVLAGRPGGALMDRGATICSCFGVGTNEIAAAVGRGCRTVDAIGERLHAGTNCGSCRGEIKKIIREHQLEPAE